MSEEVILATIKRRLLLGVDIAIPDPDTRRKAAELIVRAVEQVREELEFSRAENAAATPEVRPFLEAEL